MSNKTRYVFDTNTIISALLLNNSTPNYALHRALKYGQVLLSTATLEELAKVLQREKFDHYITAVERDEFLEALINRAVFIEPEEEIHECSDPEDNMFLELAVSGNASMIVSGDKDLLRMNPFRGIEIITPEAFLNTTDEK